MSNPSRTGPTHPGGDGDKVFGPLVEATGLLPLVLVMPSDFRRDLEEEEAEFLQEHGEP